MRAIRSIVALDLRMFFRNRQIVFFNFVMPVMLLVIFGLAFSRPTLQVAVGLVDLDHGAVSQAVRDGMQQNPTVRVSEYTEAQLPAAVARREVDLGVLVPAATSIGLAHGQPARVRVLKADPATPLGSLAQSLFGDVLFRAGAALGTTPLPLGYDAATVASRQRQSTYADFVTPGILSMAVFAFCLFSIVYVVAMRENGTLKRLELTPLTRGSFLASQVLVRLILMALQVAVLLGLAALFFGFRVAGSWWALAAVLAVAAPAYISLSYALGSFCDNSRVANGLINFAYTPQVFLGGVFFPVQSLPGALQTIVGYLPLTCLVTSVRRISVQGASLADVRLELLALVLWAVASFLVARRFFRWS
ncbi:MAG: ABC transporter permease [Vicinamibacteria bacterium]